MVWADRDVVVASGMISQYSKSDEEIYKVKNLMQIVTQRLTIRGFVWNDPDMGPKYRDEHKERIEGWLLEGSIKAPMDIVERIEKGPEGLVRMLKGENFGKVVLAV
jgi:NADPH-dependent curcumin reductase CurA